MKLSVLSLLLIFPASIFGQIAESGNDEFGPYFRVTGNHQVIPDGQSSVILPRPEDVDPSGNLLVANNIFKGFHAREIPIDQAQYPNVRLFRMGSVETGGKISGFGPGNFATTNLTKTVSYYAHRANADLVSADEKMVVPLGQLNHRFGRFKIVVRAQGWGALGDQHFVVAGSGNGVLDPKIVSHSGVEPERTRLFFDMDVVTGRFGYLFLEHDSQYPDVTESRYRGLSITIECASGAYDEVFNLGQFSQARAIDFTPRVIDNEQPSKFLLGDLEVKGSLKVKASGGISMGVYTNE